MFPKRKYRKKHVSLRERNSCSIRSKTMKEYFMKNTIKLIGFIALAAVIGISMAACGGIYEKID